jgi:hypothetical protein
LEKISQNIEIYSPNDHLLGHQDDLIVNSLQFRSGKFGQAIAEKLSVKNDEKNISSSSSLYILPSIQNHFVAISPPPPAQHTNTTPHYCRRETPMRDTRDFTHANLKTLVPNLKSIVDFESGHVLTQLSRHARPKKLDELFSSSSAIGFIEIVDLLKNEVKYLDVQNPSINNKSQSGGGEPAWQSYRSFSYANEADFLLDTSPTRPGVLYTLDFNGNLSEWETNRLDLERSLDEWQKLVVDRQSAELKLETFVESPNKALKDFKGPKHGKVDPTNAPHVGGNTWAG